jgi:hypothetical protein
VTAGSPQPHGATSIGAVADSARHVDSDHAAQQSQSVGELLANVTKDLSTLMRQEVELAKAEMKAEVGKAGKGAGMLGAAGFAGYMVLLFLSFALWWGLANVMDEGWAALITAAVWAIIAAVLAVRGRSMLKTVNPKPERTVQTVKQVPDALKGQ